MPAPSSLPTQRLLLRRPAAGDAEAIFTRYAADPEITRYLAWPRHQSISDTYAFLAFSDESWERRGVGPYLIEAREGALILGSTGIDLHDDGAATTGYVLAKDAWGRGVATEALLGMVAVAKGLTLPSLSACVHPDNAGSIRVLEKAGFSRVTGCASCAFPNLGVEGPVPIFNYSLALSP